MKDGAERVQQAAGRSDRSASGPVESREGVEGVSPSRTGFCDVGAPDSAKTIVSKGPDNPTDFSLRFFTRLADA
jgi:hypothetical protein